MKYFSKTIQIILVVIFIAAFGACKGKSIEEMEAQDFIIQEPGMYGEIDFEAIYKLVGEENMQTLIEQLYSTPELINFQDLFLEMLSKIKKIYFFTSNGPGVQESTQGVLILEVNDYNIDPLLNDIEAEDIEFKFAEYKDFTYRDGGENGCIYSSNNYLIGAQNRELLFESFDTALSGKNFKKNTSFKKIYKTMIPATFFFAAPDFDIKKIINESDLPEILSGLQALYFSMNVDEHITNKLLGKMENAEQASMLNMFLKMSTSDYAINELSKSFNDGPEKLIITALKTFKTNQNENMLELELTLEMELVKEIINYIPLEIEAAQ